MVQVPASRNFAVAPLTVQTLVVCEANETVKPEVAVAESVRGVPTVCVPGFANAIVCDSPPTATSSTVLTGRYKLSPVCIASSTQVPVADIVAVVPLTAQTKGDSEANETGSPELAVAESVTVAPTVCEPTAAKLMVWALWGELLVKEAVHPAIASIEREAQASAQKRAEILDRFIDSPRGESSSGNASCGRIGDETHL